MQQPHFYPAAPQHGNFSYHASQQGIPTQGQYPPQTQYVMMSNVQTGPPGSQPGFTIPQAYPVQGNAFNIPGQTRGIQEQYVMTSPFQTQAGPGQRHSFPQILMPVQHQPFINAQPVQQQMQQQYAVGQWPAGVGAPYSNGPQPQPPSSSSFTQHQQPFVNKKTDQRPMYPPYGNPPIAQPMNQQQTLTLQTQSQQQTKKMRSSAIKIVNPDTGLEVNTEELTKSSLSVLAIADDASVLTTTTPAGVGSNVAAEFAARVAATMNASSEAVTKPVIITAPPTSAIVNHAIDLPLPIENECSPTLTLTRSDDPNSISINNVVTKIDSQSIVTSQSSALSAVNIVDFVPSSLPLNLTIPPEEFVPDSNQPSNMHEHVSVADNIMIAIAHTDTPNITCKSSVVLEHDGELPTASAISCDESVFVEDVSKASSISLMPAEAFTEITQLHVCSESISATYDDHYSVDDSSANRSQQLLAVGIVQKEETVTSHGKDAKKKKNKKKDVNNKGQALQQGTEMDAYIVECQPRQNDESESVPVIMSTPAESDTHIDVLAETVQLPDYKQLPEIMLGPHVEQTSGAPVQDEKIVETVHVEPTFIAGVGMLRESEMMPYAGMTQSVGLVNNSAPIEVHAGSDIQAVALLDFCKIEDGTNVEDVINVVTDKNEVSKLGLKYKYSEDQWSPLNPEGKKQYDRDFMMQLQFADFSVQKPSNLPSLPDIILNEPPGSRNEASKNRSLELGRMGMVMAPDFTPGYVKSSPSGSRRPVQRNSMKKDMGIGPSGPSGSRKVINLTLQDVQLNKSENAWKPALVTKKDLAEDESLATQDLYKKVRGILNKLTPQKFATLMQQVLDLQIDTEHRLKGCIDIVFEKAISEPNFSVAYANMAKRMLTLSVPREQDPSQTVNFRTLLLNKCQQEFEKDKLEELDLAERQKQIETADSEEKRKQLTEEQDAAATKSKRRSLGNIRFIGELYKLRMLTEAIMHECLMKLLRTNDEDSLECLCQLLTTIGQELDNKQSKLQPRMDMYFKQLDALISDRNKVSSRIRFMILDTIDLRKDNWVPRRANNNPKTIEQIHKEAHEEEQKKQAEMQRAVMERARGGGGSIGNRSSGGGGRGCPPQAGVNAGEDGWNTVTRPPKSQIVDPQRLRLTKRDQVDDNIQLGPGRGMSTWQFGSRGGGKVSTPANVAQESDKQQMNRYSLLNSQGFDQPIDSRTRGGRSGAAQGGQGFRTSRDYQGSMSGPAGRAIGSRPSLERNVDGASRQDLCELSSPASSRSASHEPQLVDATQSMGAVSASPSNAVEVEFSPEEMEKKTKSLMEEYLHINDIKEATECVKELGSSSSLHLFVYHSQLLNLERTPQARQRVGTLLHHLIKNKVLSANQYIEGLRPILEAADDMVIDIPLIWQYIGELISPMMDEGGLPMTLLRKACEPLINCFGGDKAGVVLSVAVQEAVHRLGHHHVAELWHQSGLDWSKLVPAEKVEDFIKDRNLQFTITANKAEQQSTKPVAVDQLIDDLNRIYSDHNISNEKVFDYLEENVGEIDDKCIRALTTAIFSTALIFIPETATEEKKVLFDIPVIKRRLPLLTKIINKKQELELEVLFAIQVIIQKRDVYTGAISDLVDQIYDEDVVSDSTFFRWRDDRLHGEQIGRGVMINTLNQFFKWLEEDTPTS